MTHARLAGWFWLLSAPLFAPFAVGFWLLAGIAPAAGWVYAFAAAAAVCSLLCVIAGGWGLLCGYSPRAWSAYVAGVRADEARRLVRP